MVDGKSTDMSRSVIGEYVSAHPERFQLVTAAPRGVYHALNVGLGHARGDLTAVLHGNDLYASPSVLSTVVKEFDSDSDLDFVYGDVHYFNSAGRTTRIYRGSHDLRRRLRRGVAPPHPSLFMRTDLLRSMDGYREDLLVAADFDLFARLAADTTLRYRYLPVQMVAMSLGGLSTHFINRLWTNTSEKMRVLRLNRLSRTGLRALLRYFYC